MYSYVYYLAFAIVMAGRNIMPNYRRWYVPGGTYFFTVVTYRRRSFLTEDFARTCLREAIVEIRKRFAFEILAMVLLPDHLHAVWSLPHSDDRYSLRWRRIKEEFTRSYLDGGGSELEQSSSRVRHGMRGIWQKRFWEHTCEDEQDIERCTDHVHWNPKKHRIVSNVRDWPYSTFHRFVRMGHYPPDWGRTDPAPDFDVAEWD